MFYKKIRRRLHCNRYTHQKVELIHSCDPTRMKSKFVMELKLVILQQLIIERLLYATWTSAHKQRVHSFSRRLIPSKCKVCKRFFREARHQSDVFYLLRDLSRHRTTHSTIIPVPEEPFLGWCHRAVFKKTLELNKHFEFNFLESSNVHCDVKRGVELDIPCNSLCIASQWNSNLNPDLRTWTVELLR